MRSTRYDFDDFEDPPRIARTGGTDKLYSTCPWISGSNAPAGCRGDTNGDGAAAATAGASARGGGVPGRGYNAKMGRRVEQAVFEWATGSP